eukprot:1366471-Rhodomonas_salina.2
MSATLPVDEAKCGSELGHAATAVNAKCGAERGYAASRLHMDREELEDARKQCQVSHGPMPLAGSLYGPRRTALPCTTRLVCTGVGVRCPGTVCSLLSWRERMAL